MRVYFKPILGLLIIFCSALVLLNYSQVIVLFQAILNNDGFPTKLKSIPETVKPVLNDWFSVNDDIWIYSAYWETRNKAGLPFVKVVAIAPLQTQNNENNLQCCLGFENYTSNVKAAKFVIGEHWSRKHSAVFYTCPAGIEKPEYVGLTENEACSNWTTVQTTQKTHSDINLAVCVRPFFGLFNQSLELAEFISYYDSMGASEFTFYDYQQTTTITNYLEQLKKHEMNISLLPWSLPSSLDVWEKGQLAFIQDCLNRHMKSHEFVIVVDLDEYIVPERNISLLDIVVHQKNSVGSLLFRHAFFCYDDKYKESAFRTETTTQREKSIWEPFMRSKLIIRPRGVIATGIHNVQKYEEGFGNLNIEPKHALLHHYRLGYCTNRSQLVSDQSALKFVTNMKRSVAYRVWKTYFQNNERSIR